MSLFNEPWRFGDIPSDAVLRLETARLVLEPVTTSHAEELFVLFGDPELHRFTPTEPLTLNEQRERCARWARRKSPDGDELWLNWAARGRSDARVVGHFQAGVRAGGLAGIAYLVARDVQGQGLAREGMRAVFQRLRETFGVTEIKAWSDTRNLASHRLARALGMTQIELLKDADVFKGATSDEFVFSLRLT